jgi:hypothetical protein
VLSVIVKSICAGSAKSRPSTKSFGSLVAQVQQLRANYQARKARMHARAQLQRLHQAEEQVCYPGLFLFCSCNCDSRKAVKAFHALLRTSDSEFLRSIQNMLLVDPREYVPMTCMRWPCLQEHGVSLVLQQMRQREGQHLCCLQFGRSCVKPALSPSRDANTLTSRMQKVSPRQEGPVAQPDKEQAHTADHRLSTSTHGLLKRKTWGCTTDGRHRCDHTNAPQKGTNCSSEGLLSLDAKTLSVTPCWLNGP